MLKTLITSKTKIKKTFHNKVNNQVPKEKNHPPHQKNFTEEVIVEAIEVVEVAEVEDFLDVDISYREEVDAVMHSLQKNGYQKDKHSTKTKIKMNKILTRLTKNKSSLLISTKNGILKKIMEVTLESHSTKRKEMIM